MVNWGPDAYLSLDQGKELKSSQRTLTHFRSVQGVDRRLVNTPSTSDCQDSTLCTRHAGEDFLT